MRRWLGLALALAAVAGLGLAAFGLFAPPTVHPPRPKGKVRSHAASSGEHSVAASPVARSQPTKLSFPALHIATSLGPPRGLKANGTIEDAPLSGPDWALPWWYDQGPSPGQGGSAVLLGHVDSAAGRGHLGVFFHLGNAKPGEHLDVTLADHTVTHWSVTAATLYPDGHFPDAVVYNPAGPPTLRLVTCGGKFDPSTGEYQSAVVVTATLTPKH